MSFRPPTHEELTVPGKAYWYVFDRGAGRCPELEPCIASHPCFAYCYASNILNGRFPAGEAAIAKEAYYYSEYSQWLRNYFGYAVYEDFLLEYGDWQP